MNKHNIKKSIWEYFAFHGIQPSHLIIIIMIFGDI